MPPTREKAEDGKLLRIVYDHISYILCFAPSVLSTSLISRRHLRPCHFTRRLSVVVVPVAGGVVPSELVRRPAEEHDSVVGG